MDIYNLNYDEFEKFLFVLTRVAALFLFVPILGSASVPMRLKTAFILIMAIVIFPLVKSLPMPHSKGMFELAVYLSSEVAVGVIIAFIARLVFIAVEVAGTIVDFQMGFGVVNVIDPQTNSQVSITAQFQNILAVLLFLAFDAHHLFVQALVESFQLINPSKFGFSATTMDMMLRLFADSFAVAIKISAPVMAVLFFISVGLGLIARTVPQMNVFIVGFPLQIGAGLIMMGFTMTFFATIVKRQVSELPGLFVGILQSL